MRFEKENETYIKAFLDFSEVIENGLKKLLSLLLLLLLAAQLLMQIPSVRQLFSRVEPLEGQPFEVAPVLEKLNSIPPHN